MLSNVRTSLLNSSIVEPLSAAVTASSNVAYSVLLTFAALPAASAVTDITPTIMTNANKQVNIRFVIVHSPFHPYFAAAGTHRFLICSFLQMKKRVPAFGFWGLCHNNTTRFLQLQGFDRIFVEFLQKIYGRRKKASPFRGGGSAERRDGEVAADLRRPLSHLR